MFPSIKRAALARLFVSLALPTAILSLSIQHRQMVPINANQTLQLQSQNLTKIQNTRQPVTTDNAMSGSVVWSVEDTTEAMPRPRFGARHSKPLQRAQSIKDDAQVSERQRLKVAESFDDAAIAHHDDSGDHQQFEEKCDKDQRPEQEEHEVYQIPVKKVEKHHHHHHHHHHHAKKNKKPAPKEPVQLEIELKGNIKSKKKEPVAQKQEKVVKVAAKKVVVKKSKKVKQEPVAPQQQQQQQQEDDGGHQVEDQVSLIGDGSSEQGGSQQASGDGGSSSIEDRETEGDRGASGGGSGGHQELMGHEINTSHVPSHDAVVQDDGGGHQVVQEEEAVKEGADAEKPAVKEVKKEVKKKKKEVAEVKKAEEPAAAVKQVEEKKPEVVAEQPKVVVAEPAKVEEPKKEVHKKHHSKHAHIELHAHKHFEQHQHINVHPPADLGEGQVENELPLNHHAPEEVYHEEPIHNHMGDHHHQHQHEELEHIAQHHGGGHQLPLKEEWVAPDIHELSGHKQHVPGAIVIEDHSALEQQPHQPMGLNYKEEVVSHPHGFGLSPSGHGYGTMGAYSSPKSTHAAANATLNKSN